MSRTSRSRRPLRRPDLQLVVHQVGPRAFVDVIHLLRPTSRRGRAWLEANAGGRHWLDDGLVIEPAIAVAGSLPAQARDAGLGITGWGYVTGAMLEHLRTYGAPELSLEQLADRLGFTAQEWQLMESDERMIPDPDGFWDRAMSLVDELQRECES